MIPGSSLWGSQEGIIIHIYIMAENVTPVVLKVKDFQDREVMMVDYKFEQATGLDGQIAGQPRGGRIDVKVKALNDGNNQLIQWMLAPSDPRDVVIEFYNTIDGNKMKELKGTGCYCVNYKEDWEEGVGHSETIQIVCQILENGPVKFENPWK